MSRTPVGAPPAPASVTVDEVDEAPQDVRVGLGQHAPAQVEHVPGPALVGVEDGGGLAGDDVPRGQADRRVEVALDGDVMAQAGPGPVEGHPPVDADDVGASLGEQLEQLTGADPEVDAGNAEVLEPGEDSPGGGEHGAPV